MLRALMIAAVIAVPAFGGSSDDDTLRFYLSKSSLVVSGVVLNEPSVVTSESHVYRHSFRFKVDKVLKGERADDEINVTVTCIYEFDDEAPPSLKAGGKAILFLRQGFNRPEYRSWIGADKWFAVQPANRMLQESLKRVADEK